MLSHAIVPDAAVVSALAFFGEAFRRETERMAVFVEEVFLLEAEPGLRVIQDGGAGVGGVRRKVGMENFAEGNYTVDARGVLVTRDRLENAIRVVPFGLLSRTAVKAPVRQLLQLREAVEVFKQAFYREGSGRAYSRRARCIPICTLP